MELRLDGRAALITGGSKGLGLAIARAFAAAGGAVAIVAREPGALEAAATAIRAATPGATVAPISADIATAAGCQAAFDAAAAALGQVDILVNNAGTSQRGPFPAIDDALWQHDLDLKLFAAIRLGRLAWAGMAARRWGRIINVLNTGAKAPPAEGAPTAVSRAAGMALTKVQAHEGAAHNILVNALLVGLIDSDQHRRRHAATQSNESYEEWLAKQGAALPLGRYGRAEEFAATALFLCSEAGSYITGTALNVDGGRSPVV
jgi:NAD(P)-dependent dehydrogenase (short-subunit alcohol dehydrogenase family)